MPVCEAMALSRLPGIGERTASRLEVHILNQPDDLARELAEAENIRGIARQAQDPRSGTLRVGLFPTLAAAMVGFSLRGPGGLLIGVALVAMVVAVINDTAAVRSLRAAPGEP